MKFAVPGLLLGLVVLALVAKFAPQSADPEKRAYACLPMAAQWQSSAYVLPYPVGTQYPVIQANCSGHGHSNFWRHGYDFRMPIGTPVTAARAGRVTWAKDGCRDGDGGCTNLVTVAHADGTVALYSHLTFGGVLVHKDQQVVAGDPIGKSGNTGFTGGIPHLHFSVHPCNELPGLPAAGNCASVPVNFRNTDANPDGLQPVLSYVAMPDRADVPHGE